MILVGPPAKGRPLNIGWFVIGFGVEHFPCTPPALQWQLFFVSLRCLLIIVMMSVNKTLSEWQMHFTVSHSHNTFAYISVIFDEKNSLFS